MLCVNWNIGNGIQKVWQADDLESVDNVMNRKGLDLSDSFGVTFGMDDVSSNPLQFIAIHCDSL